MSFYAGGPSNVSYQISSSSSSSSSSSDEDELQEIIEDSFQAESAAISMLSRSSTFLFEHHPHMQESMHGGSVAGHKVVLRDREGAHRRLFNDYFSENPLYDEQMFRRRYRMSRNLFLRIVDAVTEHDPYFQQRRDGLGRLGLTALQKVTVVFRVLAYRSLADLPDEYIKIGESTTNESVKRFCRAVIEIFSDEYLRSPNSNDIARLLHIGESRGFPGMLGSLDCMHWQWDKCPTAWAGQYAGRSGSPSIILEAVADYDGWIWHAYFGLPGSNNDINVLERSHLFANLAAGIAPPANYVIQGKQYHMGYYLADGIYPKWATLVQTIRDPRGPKKKLFAQKQESCRKDVERAFGILQSRWAIIQQPARFWDKRILHNVMSACIIMHNMIIEDERDLNAPIGHAPDPQPSTIPLERNSSTSREQFLARHRQIRDKDAHYELRNALIEHIWEQYSNSQD